MLIPLPAFTLLHVLLSLLGILAGLVVIGGLMSGTRLNGWIATFLATTILTNATGFFFPSARILPSHIVGGISLVILPIAAAALYWKRLAGGWWTTFVVLSVVAVYFNVFVLVVQLFQKFPLLIVVAPTQQAPAFIVTQLIVLGLFIVLGRAALRGFAAERMPTNG